jgi:hypothetical protein
MMGGMGKRGGLAMEDNLLELFEVLFIGISINNPQLCFFLKLFGNL